MPDHSFRKEIFPNIQSKPPLMQLVAIASCPIAGYLGEDTNTHLTPPSFQVVVESNKVSPQPPLLQTKQPQFPQPLLRLVLRTPHQPRCWWVIEPPKMQTSNFFTQIYFIPYQSLQWCSVVDLRGYGRSR